MSFTIEVTHSKSPYNVTLTETTTMGEFQKMMYDLTNVRPEKQKFMGWSKDFDDSTPVVAIMKKKRDAVTMLGIPDRVANPDMITRGPTQPKEIVTTFQSLLMDPVQNEKGLLALIGDLKKSAMKDPTFLENKEVLSTIIGCTMFPKIADDALALISKAPKHAVPGCVDAIVETLWTSNATSISKVNKSLTMLLLPVSTSSPLSFSLEHVDKLFAVQNRYRAKDVWLMSIFNRISDANTTPFVKHISTLEEFLGDTSFGHLAALVLSRVAREQCPIKLIQDYPDIKHTILHSKSQTLKYSHGVMLLVAISCQPNASDEMKQETLMIMLDLLDEPNKGSKYNHTIFMQMVVLARDDYVILVPYQERICKHDQVPKGMVDFIEGKETSDMKALLAKIEQQMNALADKVAAVDEKVEEVSVSVEAVNERVDNVETTVEEQNLKIDDVSETVTNHSEQIEQLTDVVDTHEEQIAEVQVTVEEQNVKIEQVSTVTADMEVLKEYVDKHVVQVKEFIAQVAKKMPTPVRFTVEDKLLQKLKLHFVCCQLGTQCKYTHQTTFVTETRQWNKWLKLGVNVISFGFAVSDKKVGEAIRELKEAYETIKTHEDKDFNAYITEPFLTSEEQDKLVEQLRESKFFEHFTYDAQRAGWACKACLPPVVAVPKPVASETPADTTTLEDKKANVEIWQASASGDLDRVKYLIEYGINVNARDRLNKTALHYACKYAHWNLIHFLLEKGANLNALDSSLLSPIDEAPGTTSSEFEKLEMFVLERIMAPPTQVPDNAFQKCQRCFKEFTFFNRRHHCRHCGKLICADCSKTSTRMPSFGFNDPVRVCFVCYPVIMKMQRHTATPLTPAKPQ